MDNRYQIIFMGLENPREHFYRSMTRLGVSSMMIDRIIGNAPVILKQNLDPARARNYAEAVKSAGGKILIQEYRNNTRPENHIRIEPLENFTMCPQCGFKQLKSENCVRCGIILKQKRA